jgi:hypothetical protein
MPPNPHLLAACEHDGEVPAAASASFVCGSMVLAAATMWPSAMRTICAYAYLLLKKVLRWYACRSKHSGVGE